MVDYFSKRLLELLSFIGDKGSVQPKDIYTENSLFRTKKMNSRRAKASSILKRLRDEDLIEKFNKNEWMVTTKGMHVLYLLKELNYVGKHHS